MIIPVEILLKLKCKECLNYLSCGPVYMSDRGYNICGRCSVLQFASRHHLVRKGPISRINHSSSRNVIAGASSSSLSATSSSNDAMEACVHTNVVYNELAALYEFPCQYEYCGCTEKVNFMDMKIHEENCRFHPYECLVSDECGWTGPVSELVSHSTENHPMTVLEQPCVMEHDMTLASCQNYLTRIGEHLFIVRVKITLISPTIYYSLYKIGTIKEDMSFKYTLNIEGKAGSFIRKGDVVSQSQVGDVDIAISVANVMSAIGSETSNKFVLEIKQFIKCNKCRQMKMPEELLTYDETNDIFYCQPCLSALIECKNSVLGCTWRGVEGYKFNHEVLFCPFSRWCEFCNNNIEETSMLHHMRMNNHAWYKINHLHDRYWTIEDDKDQTIVNISFKDYSYLVICKKQSNSTYKFMMFGQYNDVAKIKCYLILRNCQTKFLESHSMKVAYSTNCGQFVWIQHVDNDTLTPFLCDKNFDFNVDIYSTDNIP